MTLSEFFAVLAVKEDEAERIKQGQDEASGRLTEDDKDELLAMLKEAKRDEQYGAS